MSIGRVHGLSLAASAAFARLQQMACWSRTQLPRASSRRVFVNADARLTHALHNGSDGRTESLWGRKNAATTSESVESRWRLEI